MHHGYMIKTVNELKDLLNDGVPDVWEAAYDCATYDPEATDAADPSGSLDIIVCTDGVLRYDYEAGLWVLAPKE